MGTVRTSAKRFTNDSHEVYVPTSTYLDRSANFVPDLLTYCLWQFLRINYDVIICRCASEIFEQGAVISWRFQHNSIKVCNESLCSMFSTDTPSSMPYLVEISVFGETIGVDRSGFGRLVSKRS